MKAIDELLEKIDNLKFDLECVDTEVLRIQKIARSLRAEMCMKEDALRTLREALE